MNPFFQSVSHRVWSEFGGALKLSHVHELLASAQGYGTFASYKVSTEEPSTFDGVVHIVLDPDRLRVRLGQLAIGEKPDLTNLLIVIRDAVRNCVPTARVHLSQEDLGDDLTEEVTSRINDSGAFISEQSMTNAYGGDYEVEFEAANTPLDDFAPEWVLELSGCCRLEQDRDRVFYGDVINVSAEVVFPKHGRRLLGAHSVQGIRAAIREDWLGEEPGPATPSLTP